MKKPVFFIIAIFLFVAVSAQQNSASVEKFDTIYMANSEVKVGSIKAIDDASISFVHKGESLVYNLKKPDISRIVFSSGRVETIAAAPAASNVIIKADVDHHNKAAILPFGYINPQQQTNTEMGYKVQDECYTYLSSKATAFTIQDPSTTNALLGKSGVTFDNVRNFTNKEICDILGVEYIVRGTITSNLASTTSSGSASYDTKSGNSSGKGSTSNKSSGNVYSSSSTQENFKTSVLMEIYSDEGKKVFGQDRTSFWQTVDAYKNTIQYLLKKSPIYGR